SCLDQLRSRLQAKFLERIDGGEILEPDGLGILGKWHFVDHFHFAQLWAGASVRGLGWSTHKATFAEKVLLNSIRSHEDIGGLGLKVIFGRAKEAKALLRDLKVTGSEIGRGTISCRSCLHVSSLHAVSQGQASRMIPN